MDSVDHTFVLIEGPRESAFAGLSYLSERSNTEGAPCTFLRSKPVNLADEHLLLAVLHGPGSKAGAIVEATQGYLAREYAASATKVAIMEAVAL